MAKTRNAKPKSSASAEEEFDLDESFGEEDHFLEELRSAVARAKSSRQDGVDLYDGLRRGGMDCVQTDFAE